jgi:hypothetical protein
MATHETQGSLVISSKHCMSILSRLAAKGYPDTSMDLFHRESYRWAFQAPAVIRYTATDGSRVTMDATIEDLSANGIGLLCKQALPEKLEAEVFVSYDGEVYSAAVRVVHTTAVSDSFRIGCAFVVRET